MGSKRRRTRKRTFPLFDSPEPPDPALLDDPTELLRLAFPELTRCDHCGVLDGTRRFDVGDPVEVRWLHEECIAAFKPPAMSQYHPPSLRREVPDLGFGRMRQLIRNGKFQAVESVRWCGGLTKCACYDDGEITAHKFRWEYEEVVMRKVKVL
jgi:hypothetical protein